MVVSSPPIYHAAPYVACLKHQGIKSGLRVERSNGAVATLTITDMTVSGRHITVGGYFFSTVAEAVQVNGVIGGASRGSLIERVRNAVFVVFPVVKGWLARITPCLTASSN